MKLESAGRRIQEYKIREDMMTSRINYLEVELKNIYQSHEILEQSNENYCKEEKLVRRITELFRATNHRT